MREPPSLTDNAELKHAARQQQFLNVIDRDTATARFHEHLNLRPLGSQHVSLDRALNRVLATDVIAAVDVPAFDRSNVDGFAVQAADTFAAHEDQPRTVALHREILAPGSVPKLQVTPGSATTIATGAMVPRGANAVVMVEHTDLDESSETPKILIRHAVSPGQNITFAGTDVARGETVLRAGQILTSREIGVVAAIGIAGVDAYRRPRVAIISTGNEIIAPGETPAPATVFDSNAAILAAAVRELGGEPVVLGIVPDEIERLEVVVRQGLEYDVVLLSGGTSKGAGDLSYRVVSQLSDPGIVAHGVALRPGKPICLAVTDGKPVVILPGFPTSAIFTFHEFVAPVIRAFGGLGVDRKTETVSAKLPLRMNSERGRTEYLLVGLVRTDDGLAAYPMGKGSGSVTTFTRADGFITIGQHTEIIDEGSQVSVQLLGQKLEAADLVVIGSHCVGLDVLLGEVQRRGVLAKALYVGSMGGLAAAKRGECDVAGVHLMDAASGDYNRSFLTPELELVCGYRRMQGIVFRPGDVRFDAKSPAAAIATAIADPNCTMVNRNAGSGTRILIDRLLEGKQPNGYAVQAKSHNAVATAIAQGRADWGVAIDTVARQYALSFLPLQEEHYDFVLPKSRMNRPAVRQFVAILSDAQIVDRLRDLGFRL